MTPHVRQLVDSSFSRSICHDYLKGRQVTLPFSYRSTFSNLPYHFINYKIQTKLNLCLEADYSGSASVCSEDHGAASVCSEDHGAASVYSEDHGAASVYSEDHGAASVCSEDREDDFHREGSFGA